MDCDKTFSTKARNMSIVAAIAVVVIHAGDGGMGSFVAKMMHQFLGWGICTFAVPWFFFASGYFFAGHLDETGWWSRAMKSRGRTLLIPYVIWCGLYICFSAGLDMVLNMCAGRELMCNLSVGKLLFDGFGLDVAQHPMLVPFWYIRALLLIVLLSPVLVYALRRWRWYVPIAMIPAYIYCCGMQDRYAMPWFLFYSTFSLAGWIYFSVGVLARLGKWEERKCRIPTWLLWAIAIPVICAGRLALYKGLPTVANVLWILNIPVLVLGVWRLVPSRAWPTWLVASAFPVYAIHYFFAHGLESTILPLCHPDWWAYAARCVLIALLSFGAAALLRSLHPRVSFLLLGGRRDV